MVHSLDLSKDTLKRCITTVLPSITTAHHDGGLLSPLSYTLADDNLSLSSIPTQRSTWLRKSPTCQQHVAPTAKCRHIWPKCPCRSDTILIPTHFFVSGFADIHQIFLHSTRGTYGEFLCKFSYVGYSWGSREILLVSDNAKKIRLSHNEK